MTTAVIVVYFLAIIYLTYTGVRKQKIESSENFSEEFFVGGRKIGPIALAILVSAGACSTGTFIGAPGLNAANGIGFALLMYFSQIPLTFLMLGVVGKKINIVGRRTNAQSYADIFRYRYENWPPLMIVTVASILIFLISSSSGEFIGGSRVIETVTGIPFTWSVVAFGALITAYTSLGGLKGISLVSVLQGFVMTLATLLLVIGYMVFFGGMPEVVQELVALNPAYVEPTAGGVYTMGNLLNCWVSYSIVIIALPWAVQSALTYKDTKTMKRACILGIIFVGIWTVFLCGWGGAAARAFDPDMTVFDYAIPNLALGTLPSVLAGIVLAGVAGAGQSTIASLFILAASSIVVNIYKAFINKDASEKQIKTLSVITCIGVGLLNILLALTNPPSLQIFILFACGGVGSALMPPFILGLYWPRTNKYGAFAGVLVGFALYAVFTLVPHGIGILTDMPMMIAAPISFLVTYGVSKMTAKPPKETLMNYFGC